MLTSAAVEIDAKRMPLRGASDSRVEEIRRAGSRLGPRAEPDVSLEVIGQGFGELDLSAEVVPQGFGELDFCPEVIPQGFGELDFPPKVACQAPG